jgi:hypothetical protein
VDINNYSFKGISQQAGVPISLLQDCYRFAFVHIIVLKRAIARGFSWTGIRLVLPRQGHEVRCGKLKKHKDPNIVIRELLRDPLIRTERDIRAYLRKPVTTRVAADGEQRRTRADRLLDDTERYFKALLGFLEMLPTREHKAWRLLGQKCRLVAGLLNQVADRLGSIDTTARGR